MIFKNTIHKTYPYFVHCPSIAKNSIVWEEIKKFFDNKTTNNNLKISKISIITWNNSLDKCILERSCRYFGFECSVLGKGIKKWVNTLKINLTLEYLNNCQSDYVLGIDGYDAAMIRPIDDSVTELLIKDNVSIIYNKTFKDNFPIEFKNFYGENWKFNRLNAGAWLGKTKFLKEFYSYLISLKTSNSNNFDQSLKSNKVPYVYKDSEQAFIKIAANNFSNFIGLDDRCEIFQILHSASNNGLIKINSTF